MASKVLVPAAPFTKLQVKKSAPEPTGGGFIIGGDPVARVAHLEHSVRFLQEQHRQMLSGLHAEIEALRERNRDLQFQLIFNKESSPKASTPPAEENTENNEAKLKREVTRLEQEASTARSEAKAAEARALQLQLLVDAQTDYPLTIMKLRTVYDDRKLRSLEVSSACSCGGAEGACAPESRAELRARLGEAERLVRRLRADAERQRREVQAAAGRDPAGGAVTNLLFDGVAARHAHLQCMKNSLHASLRASGLDAYGYQNNYHFPPVHTPDFWREPLRDDFNMVGSRGRSTRRPLTLPELSGQQMHRSTIYANNHTREPRPRANGYDKNKKPPATNGDATTSTTPKTPEEPSDCRFRSMNASDLSKNEHSNMSSKAMYPELKMVVTKLISHSQVSGASADAGRVRARRHHHRKHAPDHT
uniref:SFRICE_007015 n=1 Tax=Spodoptera frugiperda TaxID=7108 RepID=A0A2H1VDJ2_SPOFR